MSWMDSVVVAFFFFSSRRRHTRLQGDWSSDVCSSDLGAPCCASAHACAAVPAFPLRTAGTRAYGLPASLRAAAGSADGGSRTGAELRPARAAAPAVAAPRPSAFDTDTSHDRVPSARRRVAGSALLLPASPALPLAASPGSPLFCHHRL